MQIDFQHDAFNGLTSLVELHLRQSHFENTFSFVRLPSLRYLDLSDNAMLSPNSNTFLNVRNLQTLVLHRNNLTLITQAVLIPLTSLTTIDLSNNRLTRLGNGLFNGNRQLSSINLGHNQIQAIQNNIFDKILSEEARIYLEENNCTNNNFVVINGNLDQARIDLRTCFDNFNHVAELKFSKIAILLLITVYVIQNF